MKLFLVLTLVSWVEGRARRQDDKYTDRGEDNIPDLKDGYQNGVTFEYQKYEYLSVNHHETVYQAEAHCKKWGGHLVSIHSIGENNAVKKHIRGGYAWLGRTDVEHEGVYKNLDGSKDDFKSYARGQPNNYRNEDFTIIKDNGAWYDSGPPRRDHPFGPTHGFICKRERVEEQIPEDYSCFDDIRFWKSLYCKSSGAESGYRTITSSGSNDKASHFCRSAYNSSLTMNRELPESKTYILGVTLQNLVGFMNSNDRGHVGVAFNMVDEQHFDFVFFRVNTPRHCLATGYQDGSNYVITHTGPCTDVSITADSDAIVRIHVNEHQKARVLVDGRELKDYTTRFAPRNRAAALTRNGQYYIDNKIGFKSAKVCQPVQCKVEVNGKVHSLNVGDVVRTKKCETCKCKLFGHMDCSCDDQSHIKCKADEIVSYDKECCKACIPKPATCVVSGDPHYRTFDGLWHHFQGECKYMLVQTKDFEVHHGNEVRNNPLVTWTKEVMVIFKDSEYSLNKGRIFNVDNTQKVLPFHKYFTDGFKVDVRIVGRYLYFKIIKDGVDMLFIKWDGYSASNIQVNGEYKGSTGGLCGTWDGNLKNEYTLRSGEVTTDLNVFGKDWQEADDEFCPEPPPPPHECDEHPELWKIAHGVCGTMNGTNFLPCHGVIDRSGFYENCLIDVCTCMGDKSCGCASIGSYAEECSDKGISIQWRRSDLCPLPCDEGFYYDHCGSECVAACGDPDPDCDRNKCVEGCFCPAGKLFLDGKCVSPNDCVCVFEGEIRKIGDKWDDEEKCKSCECKSSGKVECKELICEQCKDGTVPYLVDKEDCCPVCLADWVQPKDGKTQIQAKVGGKVVLAVVTNLPAGVTLKKSDFQWERLRNRGAIIRISDDGKELVLSELGFDDEGGYRVRACLNNDICGFVEFSLIVTQDVLIPVDEHQVATSGDDVTFGVIVNMDPLPPWQRLMWYFEKEALLPPKNKFVVSGFQRRNVTLKHVTKASEGTYRCTLTNKDGSFHFVDFTLKVEEGGSKVLLLPVAATVTSLADGNPVLRVKTELKGVPPAAFTWSKDGTLLDPKKDKKYQYLDYRKAFRIQNVKTEDAGVYTARMQYGNIDVTADITLKVDAADVLIRSENSPLTTVEGQNAHLSVTIESGNGDNIPWNKVEWYKLNHEGDRELKITPPKEESRYRTPNNRRILVVNQVIPSDSGFYEVVVDHKGTVISEKVQLIVKESTWINDRE